jgi:hypothetical protein
MHTAYELKQSMFAVEIDGRVSNGTELLEWADHDRLGVVVSSPFGALGACLTVFLAVAAFYDVAGKKRRTRPVYPPIFLFHVGNRWGFHGEFDFWPDQKEIFIPHDPREVLRSINTTGITHLFVPDGTPQTVTHRYKEPEEAIDRLKQCYAYSADGIATNWNVSVTTTDDKILDNFERTLQMRETLIMRERDLAESPRLQADTALGEDAHHYVALMRKRLEEVDENDPALARMMDRLTKAKQQASLTERLRRIDSKSALSLLG